jgi:hypothetical protein
MEVLCQKIKLRMKPRGTPRSSLAALFVRSLVEMIIAPTVMEINNADDRRK